MPRGAAKLRALFPDSVPARGTDRRNVEQDNKTQQLLVLYNKINTYRGIKPEKRADNL